MRTCAQDGALIENVRWRYAIDEVDFSRDLPYSEAGASATVYRGTLNGRQVALKRLRWGWGDPIQDVRELVTCALPND